MLVSHEIVFKQQGENATTDKDPYAPLADFDGDLCAVKNCCMSSDSDMLVEVSLYEVQSIALPEWLSPSEWINRSIDFGYMWARGVDPEWPEHWQRRLLQLNAVGQYVISKLLKTKNFRSSFRASLCEQTKRWLEGETEYDSPLSGKQWGAVITVHDTIAVKRIDEDCYRSRKSNCGAAA
jgi:hypothetical protein